MRRTFHAFLLAALTFAMASPSCAWFEKHPVIPAVVTCSGETIPLTLVTQVYNDVLADNWIDLTLNVVPLLKDGYADLECVFGYLKVSNPETVPHIEQLKAKHADEFKGSVSLRSPGDSTVPKGPTAVNGSNAIPGDRLPGIAAGRMDPARAPAAVQFSYAGENPGVALARCQRACGGRDALAPHGDCLCLHENKRDQRQSHWVSL